MLNFWQQSEGFLFTVTFILLNSYIHSLCIQNSKHAQDVLAQTFVNALKQIFYLQYITSWINTNKKKFTFNKWQRSIKTPALQVNKLYICVHLGYTVKKSAFYFLGQTVLTWAIFKLHVSTPKYFFPSLLYS